MRALLDVKPPVALLDAAHVHHGRARAWLEADIEHGWASCPLTQNGCIRILYHPAYPGSQPPGAIAAAVPIARQEDLEVVRKRTDCRSCDGCARKGGLCRGRGLPASGSGVRLLAIPAGWRNRGLGSPNHGHHAP